MDVRAAAPASPIKEAEKQIAGDPMFPGKKETFFMEAFSRCLDKEDNKDCIWIIMTPV